MGARSVVGSNPATGRTKLGIRKVWLSYPSAFGSRRSQGSNPAITIPYINTWHVQSNHKETIWHLTCIKCKNWFTYATMEKMCIDRYTFHCPHCGSKGKVTPE